MIAIPLPARLGLVDRPIVAMRSISRPAERTDRRGIRRRQDTCLPPRGPGTRQTKASAVSAGAGPYRSGCIVKLARPWLALRTAAE